VASLRAKLKKAYRTQYHRTFTPLGPWGKGGLNHQALFELRQGMVIELGFKFWLAHENNLEEFLCRSLQIRQHTQVLERLERHVLRFIDQQRHIPALFVFLDQDVMQTSDGIGNVLGGHLEPEFLAERVQQLAK
jgi:hypothetical protein